MAALNQEQIDFFNENGYLVVEQAVDPQLLEKLTADFGEWVEESR